MSEKQGNRGAKKGAAARRAGFRLVTGEEPAGVVGLEARIRILEGELADEQRTAEDLRQQIEDYRAGQEALRQDLERVCRERDKARTVLDLDGLPKRYDAGARPVPDMPFPPPPPPAARCVPVPTHENTCGPVEGIILPDQPGDCAECAKLRQQIADCRAEEEALRQDLERVCRERDKARDEIAKFAEANGSLEARIRELTAENERLNGQRDTLMGQFADARAEIARLNKVCADAVAARDDARADAETAVAELVKMGKERDEAHTKAKLDDAITQLARERAIVDALVGRGKEA